MLGSRVISRRHSSLTQRSDLRAIVTLMPSCPLGIWPQDVAPCLEILIRVLQCPPVQNRSLNTDPPFRPLTPDSELRLLFLDLGAHTPSLPMTQPNFSFPFSHLSPNLLYSEAAHSDITLAKSQLCAQHRGVLRMLVYLVPATTHSSLHYFLFSHKKETEAQKGEETCPRSHS